MKQCTGFIWGLFITISSSSGFPGNNNNKLQSSEMITISPENFKEFDTRNGAVAVLTIQSLNTILQGTRSQQVIYKVLVQNTIMGDLNTFDSIRSYGLPKLEEGKKYLIFLSRDRRFSGDGDFQQLFCDQCTDIVIACKKEFNKYRE